MGKAWLMKSEPDVFGIDDLLQRPGKTEPWDGVRNYQARNMMRDEMEKGDLVFFYHSNCDAPGIVGIMTVAREGYPDPTAFDPDTKYFDPKSDPDKPRWYMVDVKYKRKLKRTITLAGAEAVRRRSPGGYGFAAQGQPAVGDAGHPRSVEFHTRVGMRAETQGQADGCASSGPPLNRCRRAASCG